jgi:hypothetical protein
MEKQRNLNTLQELEWNSRCLIYILQIISLVAHPIRVVPWSDKKDINFADIIISYSNTDVPCLVYLLFHDSTNSSFTKEKKVKLRFTSSFNV